MELRKLIRSLSRYYPFTLSDFWDFPGYQTGYKNPAMEIRKILLCLDFTEEVFPIAKKEQPDLILTHHPFFFGKKKAVLLQDPLKAKLEEEVLTKLHCPIYSYHTCFDKAEGGMNDTLLSMLGYEDIVVCEDSLTRLVHLEKETTVKEIAEKFKTTFSLPYVFYHEGSPSCITSFAFVAGGGSSMFMDAKKFGADLYVSGDCPHHTRLDMKRYKMNYIDISHEVEEIGFIKGMSKTLSAIDPTLNIIPCFYEKDFTLLS